VPPAETYARHYAVARATQFMVFAVIVPVALTGGWPSLRGDRPVLPSAHETRAGVRVTASLPPFVALVIAWRLPAADALERVPALTIAEHISTGMSGAANSAAGSRGQLNGGT